MRLLVICLTFFLVGFYTSNAQSLYKAGAILSSPFDTLYGQIKYKSYSKASRSCIFKDLDGKETAYAPEALFGYIIEDQLFFRSKEIGEDKVQFLEVVYQGTMILYAYRDKNQKNYFYLEDPSTGTFEILRQKIIRQGNKKSVIRLFEEVLRAMLPKSELIADEIKNVEFEHRALSNLLRDYDERYASFQGRIFKGYQKRWPPKIAPFLLLGQNRLTLNGFNEDKSFTMLYGTGLKFQKEISRGTGRLHLDLDLGYHYESYEEQVFIKSDFAQPSSIISNGFNIALFAADLGINGNYQIRNTLSFERHVITAPINLKYFFPSERFTFSINGGVHASYTVSQNGMIDGQVSQNEQVVLGVNSPLTPEKFRPGLNFGFGLYFQAHGTWFLDFQFSPSWLDQGNINTQMSALRLGYLFK